MALEIDFEVLAGHIETIRKDVHSMKTPQPLRKDFVTAQIVSSSPTVIVLNNAFPKAGRMWEVTQIGCYGADGHTAVASAIADMYAGPVAGTDSPGDFASFINSTAIPTPNSLIGKDKVFIFNNDRIYAWIYGIVSATQITLAGTILDWRIEDRAEMVI